MRLHNVPTETHVRCGAAIDHVLLCRSRQVEWRLAAWLCDTPLVPRALTISADVVLTHLSHSLDHCFQVVSRRPHVVAIRRSRDAHCALPGDVVAAGRSSDAVAIDLCSGVPSSRRVAVLAREPCHELGVDGARSAVRRRAGVRASRTRRVARATGPVPRRQLAALRHWHLPVPDACEYDRVAA